LKLWQNLRGHLLDPSDSQKTDEQIRAGSKWALELARNLIAVAGLQFLALASESKLLKAIAFCAYFALFAYCISYFRWFVPHVFPSIKNQNARALIILIILIFVSMLAYVLIDMALRNAIDEIVRVQQPPKPPKIEGIEE
jgi:hypothetical protein